MDENTTADAFEGIQFKYFIKTGPDYNKSILEENNLAHITENLNDCKTVQEWFKLGWDLRKQTSWDFEVNNRKIVISFNGISDELYKRIKHRFNK